jgi:hypothetical protein
MDYLDKKAICICFDSFGNSNNALRQEVSQSNPGNGVHWEIRTEPTVSVRFVRYLPDFYFILSQTDSSDLLEERDSIYFQRRSQRQEQQG